MKKLLSILVGAAVAMAAGAVETDHWYSLLGNAGFSFNAAGVEKAALAAEFGSASVDGLSLTQDFRRDGDNAVWTLTVANASAVEVSIGSLWISAPLSRQDRTLGARDNVCLHNCVAGDASYAYWCRYEGSGDVLLMTPAEGTSLEYEDNEFKFYIHGAGAADPEDSWCLPLTSLTLKPGEEKTYSFRFETVASQDAVWAKVVGNGGLMARVAPGMVIPEGSEALLALESSGGIDAIDTADAVISPKGLSSAGRSIWSVKFEGRGEHTLTVRYNGGKTTYLTFFVTEPLDALIRDRSAFITKNQQHRDPAKWYDGLYSIWDMKEARLLSPDDRQELPEFCVGGSDDPSNAKPVYVSEKNVFWPDRDEIASLEYYEDNFVYGKLQRTGDETPYPYGIYGSENWYQNRSGDYGDYGSGGLGRERMWRTFDYVTHLAIYYNLYLIASADPTLTKHPASWWLDMAYNTTKAFFTVPYNIKMGPMWDFHGWCDWAYKQGNFHERYIMGIIDALEREGDAGRAQELRTEWEKKVLYFTKDDPWPFGSEMFVDRTAFESSFYVADYGRRHDISAENITWTDKNSGKVYSYGPWNRSDADGLLASQLAANLAIRGIYGKSYWNLGTAWTGQVNTLCYMCQMGGTALLDYAVRYSADPARLVGIGYNSILASWALINSGYWSDVPANIGAAGWCFSPYQRSRTYFSWIGSGREPWRYDGEIDHGFTGGVHGAGTFVVDDPDFGLYAYGGTVEDRGGRFRLILSDGVCRRFFVTTGPKVGVELLQDAFEGPVTIAKDGSALRFRVANRYHSSHDCALTISLLPEGEYTLVSGFRRQRFTVTSDKPDAEVSIGLGKTGAKVRIRRR